MADLKTGSNNDVAPSLELSRERLRRWLLHIYPGLLFAVTIAVAARFLSEHYGGPTMLYALLLGMAFNFLSEEGRCIAGIALASSYVLRFGVALLGLGITVNQIIDYGFGTVALVVGSVVLTLLSGLLFSHLLGRGWRFGILTGGAVAICGASAALAIASVLPKNEFSERNTIFTVIAVTTLSTLAMILYPLISNFLGLDFAQAGIFFGATIHDVAQVIGAGYSISDETGNTATFVKLLRVAMLLPIVAALALLFRKDADAGSEKRLPIPYFVFGFAILVGVGSHDLFPEAIRQVVLDISRWCLVIAIAAIGMKTSLKSLGNVGGQAIILICGETVFLAILVLASLTIAW